MQESNWKDRLVTCVEYPGYVKSIDKCLEKISTVSAKRPGTHLTTYNIAPEDPFSKPIRGDEQKSSSLLLQVKWSTTPEQFDSEIIGLVDKTITFTSPADYQIDPCQGDPKQYTRNLISSSLTDQLEFVDDDFEHESTEEYNEMDFALPSLLPSMTYTEIIENYAYKPLSQHRVSVHSDGKVQLHRIIKHSNKKFKQIMYDADKGIPKYPIPLFLDNVAPCKLEKILQNHSDALSKADIAIIEKLQSLFSAEDGAVLHPTAPRPIWSLPSLLCCFPKEHEDIVTEMIPAVAYKISSGAWRRALVRFGYDPTTENRNRFLQSIAIHIPGDPSMTVESKNTQPSPDVNMTEAPEEGEATQMETDTIDNVSPTNASEEVQGTNKGEEETIKNIKEGNQFGSNDDLLRRLLIAPKTQQKTCEYIYQFCDLEFHKIRKFLSSLPCRREAIVTKIPGWFSSGAISQARTIIKDRIEELQQGIAMDPDTPLLPLKFVNQTDLVMDSTSGPTNEDQEPTIPNTETDTPQATLLSSVSSVLHENFGDLSDLEEFSILGESSDSEASDDE